MTKVVFFYIIIYYNLQIGIKSAQAHIIIRLKHIKPLNSAKFRNRSKRK